MDFRQSPAFSKYLESSGWKTEQLSDGTYIYIFTLPLMGKVLRIPRPTPPINFGEINRMAKKHAAILVKIEPEAVVIARSESSSDVAILIKKDSHGTYRNGTSLGMTETLIQDLKNNGYTFDNWSIEPTQTLIVDLKQQEEKLLAELKPKWRQYIRFAKKSGIEIIEADKIDTFIKIWQENGQRRGFPTETPDEILTLWRQFKKTDSAHLLFASINNQPIAASFLILWNNTCHLWHLGYNGQYPNLRPLYSLVWEAILFAKSRGCREFDFEGIEDPRLPYTKKVQPTFFKKGFGGVDRQYLGSYVKYNKIIYKPLFTLLSKLDPTLFLSLYRYRSTSTLVKKAVLSFLRWNI